MSGDTPMQAELFGRLFVLDQRLTRQADAALGPFDLTTRQWLLLAVLVTSFPGGAPTLTEAAGVYGTSRQNVKQVAQQLAARGFVELVTDPRDRRATRVVPTARLAELDEPTAVAMQEAFLARTFACLSGDELTNLNSLVGRCLAHLGDGRGGTR